MKIRGYTFGHALLATAAAFLMCAVCSCAEQEKADLILTGGAVYTMNEKTPEAEAVAIRRDRILFVGAQEEARSFADENTVVIDISGMAAYPGFVDAHAHLISLGRSLSQLDLVGTGSAEEVRRRVMDEQASMSAGEWIRGRGWDQNDWEVREFPTWKQLNGTEANPVYLRRVDGHAVWVNQTALDLCGITKRTADPTGGRIVKDADGNPTGVFIDDAIDLVTVHMPDPSLEEKIAWAKRAVEECNRRGLVGMHDAGIHALDLSAYETLHERGDLTLRIYAMADADSADFLRRMLDRGPSRFAGGRVIVRSIKMYADGALGSRGAALLEPYSDDPGNRGLFVTTEDSLYRVARAALEHDFQVCTHAIGDAANRLVLDAYERALKEHPKNDHRFRIEHAQVVSRQDIPRFAALGVIPSMQPTHATSDMYWAEDRVGSERIKGAYAWRTFIDQGCRIPCGSDFPVEGVDPLWGIYAAVTRRDREGAPDGGWYPGQCMTVREAVAGFTIHAAYAAFMEDETGSIEKGKLADITVLDGDLFRMEPERIQDARTMYTIVGGKVVYSNPPPR
jgi:predicted amidohydrolase YtcJ